MVTRRVEQITSASGVEVKEDAGHNDDLLLQTGLEEVEAVTDLAGQALKIQPQVEGRVGDVLDVEAHLAQALDHVVALHPEVELQRLHLLAHQLGLQHRYGGLLEGRVGTAVQVRAARADGLDELLGAQNPGHAPAGQAEALGEAVDDKHVVLVDVLDVVLLSTILSVLSCLWQGSQIAVKTYSSRDGRAVTVGCVVVAGVELVADEGRATAADVLNLSQLWVLHNTTRRVTGVGRQDDTSASCDLLSDLVRVDVVAIFLAQRDRNSGELDM